jgi:hypothetical protein
LKRSNVCAAALDGSEAVTKKATQASRATAERAVRVWRVSS